MHGKPFVVISTNYNDMTVSAVVSDNITSSSIRHEK